VHPTCILFMPFNPQAFDSGSKGSIFYYKVNICGVAKLSPQKTKSLRVMRFACFLGNFSPTTKDNICKIT
jgi:hypothetical protein